MNGKVTDADIQQWAEKHGLTSRTIREAYEEANHQPAKPEAVRLRDELRERAEFEAWAESEGAEITKWSDGSYTLPGLNWDWTIWQAALSATGTQQVGTFPWENFPAYLIDKCEGDTISEEGIQRAVADMARDARYCQQQVGEVQGVRLCFWTAMTPPTTASTGLCEANAVATPRGRACVKSWMRLAVMFFLFSPPASLG